MKDNRMKIFSLTFLLLLFVGSEVFAGPVNLAVASDGQEQDANICEQAARAPYFLFFDGHGVFLESVQNPAKDLKGGAGSSASEFLAERGVKTVIAGSFGDKMRQALQEYHIEYLEKKGITSVVVQEMLKKQ